MNLINTFPQMQSCQQSLKQRVCVFSNREVHYFMEHTIKINKISLMHLYRWSNNFFKQCKCLEVFPFTPSKTLILNYMTL